MIFALPVPDIGDTVSQVVSASFIAIDQSPVYRTWKVLVTDKTAASRRMALLSVVKVGLSGVSGGSGVSIGSVPFLQATHKTEKSTKVISNRMNKV